MSWEWIVAAMMFDEYLYICFSVNDARSLPNRVAVLSKDFTDVVKYCTHLFDYLLYNYYLS